MKKQTFLTLAILVALLLSVLLFRGSDRVAANSALRPLLRNGTPTVVSYQGYVEVSSTEYNGDGYFKFAVVDGTATTSYWSNDGSSTVADEPTAAVTLPVTGGLFQVYLGDTSLAGMTQALSASVFDDTDRYLRVWFSVDNATYDLLSPDRRVTAVPYALQSEESKTAADADTLDLLDSSAFWQLGGNAATTPGTHYLGTSDAVSLSLATNGTEALRIDTAGYVGLGTDSPAEQLTVRGNAHVLGQDNPVTSGYISTNLDYPFSVFVADRYAYVASSVNNRLSIFDVSDPDNPVVSGYISTNLNSPSSVFVAGRYAYVASSDNNRMSIFDVSDPANPVATGTIGTNLSSPRSVFVTGRYAYVASLGNNNLAIFDVSDPANPAAVGYTSTNLSYPHSVFVDGRYAYVASLVNNRLAIFDVSDPTNPVASGYTDTNLNGPVSVFVAGRYAYVASYNNNRLAIFDVSDPANPAAAGYTGTNLNDPYSVFVAGRYAYVASEGNNHLAVFDVSDPANPAAAGYTGTNLDGPRSVFVAGRYAYAASSSNSRLAIFELNHLEAPTAELGSLRTGGLHIGESATVGNQLNVLGSLNVGQSALVDGDLAIGGEATFTGYVQLATVSAAPPSADCNEASEEGRMKFDPDADLLYICSGVSGWVTK